MKKFLCVAASVVIVGCFAMLMAGPLWPDWGDEMRLNIIALCFLAPVVMVCVSCIPNGRWLWLMMTPLCWVAGIVYEIFGASTKVSIGVFFVGCLLLCWRALMTEARHRSA